MDYRLKLIIFIISLFFSTSTMAEKKEENNKIIKLDQIVVPVVVDQKSLASYVVHITLELTDEKKSPLAHTFLHRIQDGIIEELYVMIPFIWDGTNQPDQQLVTSRLKMAIDKILPKDLLENLYVTHANLYKDNQKAHTLEGNKSMLFP